MKKYTFTFYSGCDRESFYKPRQFFVSCVRLSQAVSVFSSFFNSLDGFRDFSPNYKLDTGRSIQFRYFRSHYYDLFNIVKPNFHEEIQ